MKATLRCNNLAIVMHHRILIVCEVSFQQVKSRKKTHNFLMSAFKK